MDLVINSVLKVGYLVKVLHDLLRVNDDEINFTNTGIFYKKRKEGM